MSNADAKKLSALFDDLPDVEHYIGVAMIPLEAGKPPVRIAFVRLVFLEEKGTLRPWPKKLKYKSAVEYPSEMRMFAIYEEGQTIMDPLLVTEWHDSCGVFTEAAEEKKLFIVEIITPTWKKQAWVHEGTVYPKPDRALAPGEHQEIRNLYRPPA